MTLDLDALQPGSQTASDQLHQQMQLYFPVLARVRAGDAEQPGRAAFDEIADEQHRSDAEMVPKRRIVALIAARIGGVAQFGDPQRRQTRLHQGKASKA